MEDAAGGWRRVGKYRSEGGAVSVAVVMLEGGGVVVEGRGGRGRGER